MMVEDGFSDGFPEVGEAPDEGLEDVAAVADPHQELPNRAVADPHQELPNRAVADPHQELPNRAVAGDSRQELPNGASSDDIQPDKIIYKTTLGTLFRTTPYTFNNNSPNQGEFLKFKMAQISRDDTRRRTWLLVEVAKNAVSFEDLVDRLVVPGSIPVCVADGGQDHYKVFMMKSKNKYEDVREGDEPEPKFLCLDAPVGAVHFRNYFSGFFQALMQASVRVRSNFDYKLHESPDMVSKVVAEFSSLNAAEVQNEIARSKMVPKKQRTMRDECIIKCNQQIVAEIKAKTLLAVRGERHLADLDSHMSTQGLEATLGIKCFYMDVNTYEVHSFPLSEYAEAYATKFSLVLYGAAGLGKTPLGKLLCCLLSKGLQTSVSLDERFYVVSGTVDGLRQICHELVPGTAILLDDVTPSAMQGSREPLTVDQVKHLCNIVGHETISARFNDLVIPDSCPRIFTSNCVSPHDWMHTLPYNIFGMDNAAQRRAACSPHATAILKRVCFAEVVSPIVASGQRESFWQSRLEDARGKMVGVLRSVGVLH